MGTCPLRTSFLLLPSSLHTSTWPQIHHLYTRQQNRNLLAQELCKCSWLGLTDRTVQFESIHSMTGLTDLYLHILVCGSPIHHFCSPPPRKSHCKARWHLLSPLSIGSDKWRRRWHSDLLQTISQLLLVLRPSWLIVLLLLCACALDFQ
jgi:hypothetical protein